MSAEKPEPATRHLVYDKVTGDTGIWIANGDGSEPHLLLPDGDAPTISPDGKWIAYLDDCSESTGRCSLYLTPTAKAKPKLLASGFYGEFRWSPKSDRIAAARAPDDEGEDDEGALVEALVSIEVPSGEKAAFTQGSLYGWSFSPDGEQIVYAIAHQPNPEGFNAEKIDLFVAASDGGEGKRITDSGDNGYPVWGPKAIAFAKLISCLPPAPQDALDGCTKNAWGRHEIWQVQADGSSRRPIVSPTPKRFLGQGYLGLIPIDWSDDGRALLAGWLNEWGRIPMAVDVETGDVRQLAEDQASEGLALSRDGKMALVEALENTGFNPESNSVLIAPYSGGKAQLVASGARGASWNR